MRWQWGYCFTRCTNTLVQHACIRSVSRMARSHLRQASRLCHILARGKLFVWVVNQRSVYSGLLDWQCPVSKWCFSCQHFEEMGTNLHLINPTSSPRSSWGILLPPTPSTLPPPHCFMSHYCLKPSSLKDGTFLQDQNHSSCSHWVTDRHVFSLFSGLECLIKKAWLGPLMSIWIKSAQWLPGHSPHSNWKPNVHPPHIN